MAWHFSLFTKDCALLSYPRRFASKTSHNLFEQQVSEPIETSWTCNSFNTGWGRITVGKPMVIALLYTLLPSEASGEDWTALSNSFREGLDSEGAP
eukprot:1159055-Pelagomonas_calceolata.AAC.9